MNAAFAPFQMTAISAAISESVASAAIQILGDSTGNENTEWVYLTAQAAAAAAPGYEVRHHVWDSANQNMPRPAIVQAAPLGQRHIPMTGAAQSFPSWPGPAVTGDIDVRTRVEPTAWARGSEQCIVGQFPESTEAKRAWKFGLSPSGMLTFQWSTDGAALQAEATSGAWTPPPGPLWVRAVLDVANATNHVIRFYQSTDGTNWMQVNTGTQRTGNTSIFASSAPYQLGGRGLAAGGFVGKIYEVEIRNGWTNSPVVSDFPTITPCLPEHWNATPSTPSPAGSPILSFVNGSHPGANFAYLANTARLGKMTPNYGQKLIIVSSSHNEASVHGEALRSLLIAYEDAVSARLPGVPFGICTQNPRLAPANRIIEQSARRAEYLAWAQAYGWTPFDTYGKFLADGRGVAALLNADGFHPNVDGSLVWAGEIQRVLGI